VQRTPNAYLPRAIIEYVPTHYTVVVVVVVVSYSARLTGSQLPQTTFVGLRFYTETTLLLWSG